jgi:hypothetical protein
VFIVVGSQWVPYHHGMARPQVADGEDGLQIWRVTSNILYKQSRTDKGWSSSLGVGREPNNSSPQEIKRVINCHKKPRTWTDSLDK